MYVSSYLPPHSRFLSCKPPIVVTGPPTVIPLLSYGLFMWTSTAYLLPVAPPRQLVYPMTCHISVSPASLWSGIVTPRCYSLLFSSFRPTEPRTMLQTAGLHVSPPLRTSLTPICMPLHVTAAFPTSAIPPTPCLCSVVLPASHCQFFLGSFQGIVTVAPLTPSCIPQRFYIQ